MKRVVMLFMLCGSVVAASAQIKVANNGKVGIGAVTTPVAVLHMKGYSQVLEPTNYNSQMHFVVGNADPRIQPSSKVVFYKLSNTGYADIQCASLDQQSDSTLKTNIHKIEGDVLSKVCKIDGVTYNWKDDKDGKLQVGFIAQEVEKVFPELVETVDTSNIKLMSYIGMIPYLLEAIKEQQSQIEELKEQLVDNNFGELKSSSIYDESNTIDEKTMLYQNKPNPFTSSTKIEMFIPTSVSKAMLYIYDFQGKQVKSITVTGREKTSVSISGSELQAGLYIYSLVTDGKLIGSKQMVLTE